MLEIGSAIPSILRAAHTIQMILHCNAYLHKRICSVKQHVLLINTELKFHSTLQLQSRNLRMGVVGVRLPANSLTETLAEEVPVGIFSEGEGSIPFCITL